MRTVKDIQLEIEKLEKKIERIQEACSHPEDCMTEEYGSNTGNYDPSADCYWTTYHCGLCDKSWTEYKDAHTYI